MKYLSIKERFNKENAKNEKLQSQVKSELGDYASNEYESLVNSYIRTKYSLSNELSIIRQKNEKPKEWQEYYDFVEECKAQAKKILEI